MAASGAAVPIRIPTHSELRGQRDDKTFLKRINLLISDTKPDPHHGLGKPEGLCEDLAGYSSRRITEEHRMVYTVTAAGDLLIVMAKYHY